MTEEGRAAQGGSAEELFGILADQSPNMIFINNLRSNVYVNQRCVELTGYSAEELCSPDFDFLRLVAPEDRQMLKGQLEMHRRGQEVSPYSYRLMHREGWRVEVVNSTRLITYGGQPALLGVVTDISEIEHARQALAESEARYYKLIELLPDGVAVTDLEGQLLVANPQLARLLGYDSPAQLHRHAGSTLEQVPPGLRERARAEAAQLATGGGVRYSETELIRRDGSPVSVEIAHSVLTDEEGRATGFIRVIRDISDRKRAEALEHKVLQAQKLESLGVLAGGIAHDFNNLLMGVMGNASLALQELPADSPTRPRVEQIDSAASRAAELTRQLLAYSGKGSFEVRPVVLAEFVQGMGDLLAVTLPKKAALKYRFERTVVARVDTAQLHQVIMNLIINAAEALEDRVGTVTVSTGRVDVNREQLSHAVVGQDLPEGSYALLEVADSGRGIRADTLERMFDPFFTTKGTGRGLGLAAVLGIVRGHRGAMWVESRVGEGTTVRVVLPLATTAAGVTEAVRVEAAPLERSKGTILVVDDESIVRRVATRMLEKLGYQVITVTGGNQAVESMRQRGAEIRAVLLDMNMPELNGRETLALLREMRSELPVLLSSGYDAEEVVRDLQKDKYTGFLKKPYRTGELFRALRALLD